MSPFKCVVVILYLFSIAAFGLLHFNLLNPHFGGGSFKWYIGVPSRNFWQWLEIQRCKDVGRLWPCSFQEIPVIADPRWFFPPMLNIQSNDLISCLNKAKRKVTLPTRPRDHTERQMKVTYGSELRNEQTAGSGSTPRCIHDPPWQNAPGALPTAALPEQFETQILVQQGQESKAQTQIPSTSPHHHTWLQKPLTNENSFYIYLVVLFIH